MPSMTAHFCPQQWTEDAKAGRLAHIEALLRDNHGMLQILAARYASAFSADVEDLYQEGSIALVAAYDSFDPERGWLFSTWSMRLAAKRMISYGKNRVPLIGMKSRSATDWQDRRFNVMSLDALIDGPGGTLLPVCEIIPADTDGNEAVLTACEHAELRRAILSLPARHQRILQYRYWHDLTLAEIARKTGQIRQNAAYHERKALDALRRALKPLPTSQFNPVKD